MEETNQGYEEDGRKGRMDCEEKEHKKSYGNVHRLLWNKCILHKKGVVNCMGSVLVYKEGDMELAGRTD